MSDIDRAEGNEQGQEGTSRGETEGIWRCFSQIDEMTFGCFCIPVGICIVITEIFHHTGDTNEKTQTVRYLFCFFGEAVITYLHNTLLHVTWNSSIGRGLSPMIYDNWNAFQSP